MTVCAVALTELRFEFTYHRFGMVRCGLAVAWTRFVFAKVRWVFVVWGEIHLPPLRMLASVHTIIVDKPSLALSGGLSAVPTLLRKGTG
jgi:hypothetical protein